jgi:heme iron utilization protein
MPEDQTPAAVARRAMLSSGRAMLATTLGEGVAAWPYASLVLVAFDTGLAPLLLISTLAEHTRNLERNPRASLLFDATEGLPDPLTGIRVTLLGEASRVSGERLLDRYVARQPSAEIYKSFKDFGLWRLAPARAHLVAGFGRIHWLEAAALLPSPAAAEAIAAAEPGILEHMNRDHAATLDLCAAHFLGRTGTGWRLTGIDCFGADLRRDAAVARLEFDAAVQNPEEVRRAFVHLARLARGEPSSPQG